MRRSKHDRRLLFCSLFLLDKDRSNSNVTIKDPLGVQTKRRRDLTNSLEINRGFYLKFMFNIKYNIRSQDHVSSFFVLFWTVTPLL